ncbi:MAG: FtsQ-type POTRA domain-containing protein [Oscillospiraceae bacterium]|nr:FtsQ-type POTRA domain-containing protein [Oscillospiraceae bacterium]
MAAKTKKRKKAVSAVARRRRKRFFAWLFSILLIIGVAVTTIVFMKIQNVMIGGDLSYYTSEDITSVLGDLTGKNLIFFNSSHYKRDILKAYPYLDDVTFERQFPDTILVKVKEIENCLALPYNGGMLIVSDELKIVDNSERKATNIPSIYGIQPLAFTIGEPIEVDSENEEAVKTKDELLQLIKILEDYEIMDRVTAINVRDRLNLSLVYDNRIFVSIGTISNLDYKIKMMSHILKDEITPTATGELDLSYTGQTKKSYFRECELEVPPGYYRKASKA